MNRQGQKIGPGEVTREERGGEESKRAFDSRLVRVEVLGVCY